MTIAIYFLGSCFLVLAAAIVVSVNKAASSISDAKAMMAAAPAIMDQAERIIGEAKSVIGRLGGQIERVTAIIPDLEQIKSVGTNAGAAYDAVKAFAFGASEKPAESGEPAALVVKQEASGQTWNDVIASAIKVLGPEGAPNSKKL